MSVHSIQRKKRKDPSRIRCKGMASREEFLSRISQTLYYGKLPDTDRFSLPVSELAAELFSEIHAGRSLDRLRLQEAAEISRNACISPCSLVLAVLYLERLKITNPEYVRQITCSELFIVTSLVASKFLNDDGSDEEVFNSEWAVSADIEVKDLNKLEKDFLRAIDWDVGVKNVAFWNQLEEMERLIAFKEGRKRGWFSYTDLERLLDSSRSLALAQAVISVSAVCLAAYTAGLLTLVGSTIIAANVHTTIQNANVMTALQSEKVQPLNTTSDDPLPEDLNTVCTSIELPHYLCSEPPASISLIIDNPDKLNESNKKSQYYNSRLNFFRRQEFGLVVHVSDYLYKSVTNSIFSYLPMISRFS